ncbi:hypothetical protein FN3523_1720 [Francisella hispaniensis]|uniref:Uncharacterized protein n=1 Tax=Francisella hispaniensis TaxID=622488 RepID=F4BHS9_9GAMM|nr:hypothetical protein FN3523_1720 [Francisella hispaniensis]
MLTLVKSLLFKTFSYHIKKAFISKEKALKLDLYNFGT